MKIILIVVSVKSPSQLFEVVESHPSRTGVDPPDAPLLGPRPGRRLGVPQGRYELSLDLFEATHHVSRRKGACERLQEGFQFA